MSVIHTPAGDKLSYDSEEIDLRLSLMGGMIGNAIRNGFNQLVKNGNFADGTSDWLTLNATLAVSEGVATTKGTARYGEVYKSISVIAGHKYLMLMQSKADASTDDASWGYYVGSTNSYTSIQLTTSWSNFARIITPAQSGIARVAFYKDGRGNLPQTYIKNCMLIDLAAMFGAGNEPTLEQFRHLYTDSYYPYQSGDSIDLLWENSTPYSTFAAQDITVHGDYPFYLVAYHNWINEGTPLGYSCQYTYVKNGGYGAFLGYAMNIGRRAFFHSSGKFTFYDNLIAAAYPGAATVVTNTINVPVAIYGIR